MDSYIPLALESLQVNELPRNSIIGEDSFVLLQQSIADLGVIAFRDCIFEVCLLNFV
jgi:hypothetical protein